MASVDARWMPVTGRHEVSIGTSLGRALRARKGIPKRASNLPDRELYSFRYNFKPESIDPDKPGSIEVKRTKESTNVSMERPGLQPRESHLFKGTEQPVKEYDCVLVYDEEMGTFTLEKIDSFMTFTHDRKVQSSSSAVQRETASPMAITPQLANDDADLVNQLEMDLVGLEDAEGEPDDDFEEVIATVTSAQNNLRFEEEEEEEEEELLLAASKPPPPPTLPTKPKPPHNVHLKQQEPIPKPKLKSKEVSRPKIEPETEDIIDSELEEVLAFGVPTRTAKRRKLSPPVVVQKVPTTTQLALPSSSTSVTLPSSRLPPPKEESDSEEEGWDPVVGDDIVENDTQEIDLEEFEQEMEQHLEELDEDILAAAMPSESAGRPMSLNQFAGGGGLSQEFEEEDSTSSSDDSDED